MSVDLSIGLCCVISVIVCKFCGLRLALPIANKPTPSKYSNRSANTQYQRNITNQKNINLIENYIYIAQLCSAFQTVECKIQSTTVLQNSREKVHAVALLLSQTELNT